MKKIIAAVSIVCVIALSMPFVNGILMEKYVHQALDDLNRINENSGTDIRIKLISYKRGFGSSEVEWEVDFGKLKELFGIQEFFLTERASHGFFGVTSKTSLEKNKWFEKLVNEHLSGVNPLEITTRYQLSGTIETTFDIDEFTTQIEQDTLVSKAAVITSTYTSRSNKIAMAGKWEGLSMPGVLTADGLSMTSDLQLVTKHIWEGTVDYALENLLFFTEKGNFDLQNIKSHYFATLTDDQQRLSLGFESGFNQLKTDRHTIKDAALRLETKMIDVQGYEEFMELYTRMMADLIESMPEPDQSGPEEVKAAMDERMNKIGFQMMAVYEKLLKKDLEIRLSDFHAQTDSGVIQGDLTLRLKQDVTFMQLLPLIASPSLFLDIFSLQSTFKLPVELVGEKPQLTLPFYQGMQTGLFIREGDYLSHVAETKNGKLLLNGQEVLLH